MDVARTEIRVEDAQDRDAVRAVNVAAFEGDAEADVVERLHNDGDVLFGLVADVDGDVVGHVLFSRLPLEMAQGMVSGAALAPLAVRPDWQRRGIGAGLVHAGLRRCREMGIAVVVVLGDPAYYGRFGFRAETAKGLRSPWSGPYLMAIALESGALGDGVGTAVYAAAFGALVSEA